MSVGNLVAQCTGSAPCELPTGLPWYFGLAVGAVWLAVVVGVLVLGRHLLRAKFDRRRRSSDRRALERSTPGSDVERW